MSLPRLEQILVSETRGGEPPTLLVCGIREQERPLKGAAGELDWRLKGFLSRFLIRGHITGRQGELTYVPVLLRGSTRHILLVGLGAAPPERVSMQSEAALFKTVAATMKRLGFAGAAVSQSNFPQHSPDEIKSFFQPVPIEVTL